MTNSALHVLNGERGLDTYPSVYNSIHLLAEQGAENHIITGGSINGFESLLRTKIKFDGGYLSRAWQLSRICGQYDLVILYEPRDVEIFYLATLFGANIKYKLLIHHSLEIPTQIVGMNKIKSCLHKFLFRGYSLVNFLIIQDDARKQLFYEFFPSLRKLPSIFVPNSYMLEVEPHSNSVEWFDKIKKYGRPIVTYTGAIERWALSIEFFKSICKRQDVSFVFSGWSNDGFAKIAIDACRDSDNVFFDLSKKSQSELNYIVINSDIGLVFYDSRDPNVSTIGLSSGKLHKFLSYGKPVVVNDLPTMKTFVEERGFGCSVDVSDFPLALDRVLRGYKFYSGNIRENYANLINFRSSYSKFIELVLKI